MSEDHLPIAVIGAGFSGTMTALHLVGGSPARRVLLCERGPTFGRGAAYSTDDPVHLLNVRAGNMSAFPDRPDHFDRWLESEACPPDGHVHDTGAGRFVSRALYGRYVSTLVEAELGRPEGALRLTIVPDEAVALTRHPDGGFDLALAGGRSHRIAGAVLAVGNLMTSAHGQPGRIVHHPWAVRFTEGLVEGRPVVVVGTGLTMVDVVTSLHRSGFTGPVTAISRRGLLPRTHARPQPWRLSRLGEATAAPLSRMMRAVRQEVDDAVREGLPWQSVMDAMRPITGSLWRGMAPDDQLRFIRHARPWWDVHRHRMAPPVAEQLRGLLDLKYLKVTTGHLRSVAETADGGVLLRWRPRCGGGERSVAAQRVIYATGPSSVATAHDPLLDCVIRAGLARVDRHGLGLDATDDLHLVGSGGEVVRGLLGIGPIVRGSFWECTPVPDIRNDAKRLAETIVREVA